MTAKLENGWIDWPPSVKDGGGGEEIPLLDTSWDVLSELDVTEPLEVTLRRRCNDSAGEDDRDFSVSGYSLGDICDRHYRNRKRA
jgi:hypothetical protein